MIDKFTEWFAGTFENREQAFGRPLFYIYVRLTHVKLDNGFFYGEQQNVFKDFPYRQFLLKPFVDGDNLIVKNYDFNKELHVGCKNLDQLTEDTMTYKPGCDNIFSFDGDKFVGGVDGCNCHVRWEDKDTYVINSIILRDGSYDVYDKGVDVKTGDQIWGSRYGHYKFLKTS